MSGKIFFSHGTTNSKGVAVIFKNFLKYELGMVKGIQRGDICSSKKKVIVKF